MLRYQLLNVTNGFKFCKFYCKKIPLLPKDFQLSLKTILQIFIVCILSPLYTHRDRWVSPLSDPKLARSLDDLSKSRKKLFLCKCLGDPWEILVRLLCDQIAISLPITLAVYRDLGETMAFVECLSSAH